MGNNACPYSILVGEKYTFFIDHQYNFSENDKIEENTLLKTIDGSIDPINYHVEKCCVNSSISKECELIHTFWLGVGVGKFGVQDVEDFEDVEDMVEDVVEPNYYNGINAVVKFLFKNVLYVMRKILFMHLDNVVIFVSVNNVLFKIEVIVTY